MHLDSEFLNWYPEAESGHFLEADAISRPYDIWRHARGHTTPNATDHDRIDAIGALRRAINHRLKCLRASYNLDCLPSALGKKQTLERLQEFGIVRSAIIKDLLEVRNLIEHEDSEPPDIGQCCYYVDIVWYFLKSTDKLLNIRYDFISFMHEDDQQFVEIHVDYVNDWRVKINANVQPRLLSEAPIPGAIVVNDFEGKPPRSNGILPITGNASFAGVQLMRLARGCFSAVGYWHHDNDT